MNTNWKRLQILGLALTLTLGLATAQADPILDAGWDSQDASAPGTPTDESPFGFTLTSSAYLRVVDCCVAGDTWTVTDTGTSLPILVTTLLAPTVHPGAFGDGEFFAVFDAAWTDPASYTRGELLLGPGTYSLSLSTDGVGGLPASGGIRLDSAAAVPEPASVGILGLGLLALARFGRRFY